MYKFNGCSRDAVLEDVDVDVDIVAAQKEVIGDVRWGLASSEVVVAIGGGGIGGGLGSWKL